MKASKSMAGLFSFEMSPCVANELSSCFLKDNLRKVPLNISNLNIEN